MKTGQNSPRFRTAALFFFALSLVQTFALEKVYENASIVWDKPDILLWGDITTLVTPGKFCEDLGSALDKVSTPRCRVATEWEADSNAAIYATWLENNIGLGLTSQHLKARHAAIRSLSQHLEDKDLFWFHQRGDTLWVARFQNDATEPVALAFIVGTTNLPSRIAQLSAFFENEPVSRLSPEEKAKAALAPDAYFAEMPKHDFWIGVASGWTQAQVPLTPSDWYQSKMDSRIRGFRNVNDSLSAWNWLEDESMLLSLYGGFTWRGFIGAEIFARHSTHKAKIDPSDSAYNALAHWDFTRTEIGITGHLSRTYPLATQWDWGPHGFIGFSYSFLSEDIALREGFEVPAAYSNRVLFKEFYKGALIGGGARLTYNSRIAVDVRTGLASRGRSLDREPSADAVAEPTIIGGSTQDWFVTVGLEYHWRTLSSP